MKTLYHCFMVMEVTLFAVGQVDLCLGVCVITNILYAWSRVQSKLEVESRKAQGMWLKNVNPQFQSYGHNFSIPTMSPLAQPRLEMGGPVITVSQPSPPPSQFGRVEVIPGLTCPGIPVGYMEEHQALTVRQGQVWERMGRMGRRVGKLEVAMARHKNQHLAHLGGLLERVNLDLNQAAGVRGLVQGQEGRLR